MFNFIKESDESLVKGTLNGQRDDFGVLVRRYLPAVRAVAFARLRNSADVDDAVQESFLRAFEQLDTLREPAKFGPWVLAIARDRAYKMLRKNVREQRAATEIFAEEIVMGPDVERRELWERVYSEILQNGRKPAGGDSPALRLGQEHSRDCFVARHDAERGKETPPARTRNAQPNGFA